jgi:hypothetical protein
MEMLATSDEVVCVTVYRHCLTLHTTVKRQKSNSLLCMPTYTDNDMDFAAMRYVSPHMQTLVWLPIHSAFAYANAGHLQFKNNCHFCFWLR